MKIKFNKDTWLVKHVYGGFAGISEHKAVEINGGIWFEIEGIEGLNIHVEGKKNVCDGYFTYLLNVPQYLYEIDKEMRYIEVPHDCISSRVLICPLCSDTKLVSVPSQTIKLTPDPEYRTECSKCNIWWNTYRTKVFR